VTLGNWLWAIPVFGLMIFMHELGHFAVAKFFGIRVREFALGFGPSLLGFDWGETRYSLRAIPLGGYVRMAGMDPGDTDDPDGFNNKPIYARALTIFAGPFMNFLLACLLFSTLFYAQGVPVDEPVLGEVMVDCEGHTCPAVTAGLQPGDRVLTINGEPVNSWTDILTLVRGSGGAPVEMRLERKGQEFTAVLTPTLVEGRYIIGIQQATRPGSFWKALAQGPSLTYEYSKAWVLALVDALVGRQELQLTGPVGITREIATQASAGLDNVLWLTAFLSVNLGLFNLLPIPALDGSHLLFMAVEAIRGRKLDPERVSMVHFFGFLLLMGLILVVTYADLRAMILGQ